MASYEYTVIVDGQETIAKDDNGRAILLGAAQAIDLARKTLAKTLTPGKTAEVWRRREGSHGHGAPHRAYIVGDGGIVRRTDK